ncbi:glycosyltransferase [Patescibacteria group bacterium]
MKIVIVIPTYNEAENVGRLLPLILKETENFSHHEINILVVDDSSPDGTADIVSDLSQEYKNIHLLLRKEKEGLGAAYIHGFKYAMENMGAEAVIEMDADFQHDPKDLPKLIEELDKGADYVIGSRFIEGGSIPKEWAFYRKFLSVVGNIVSKMVLGVFNINDFTTGFKLTRVEGFLNRVDLGAVNSKGFAYKIDLLYKMSQLGAKICEVPIKFGLRGQGDSKMERDNAIDSLKVIILLRIRRHLSFLKFVVVGFIGLFVDSTSFNILRITPLGSDTASYASGLIGMLTTYTLNNLWSFGDRKIEKNSKKIISFIVYCVSSYIPIIFRSWLIGYSTTRFGDTFVTSNLAFFVGIFIGLIWNYAVYSRLIWKKNVKIG